VNENRTSAVARVWRRPQRHTHARGRPSHRRAFAGRRRRRPALRQRVV